MNQAFLCGGIKFSTNLRARLGCIEGIAVVESTLEFLFQFSYDRACSYLLKSEAFMQITVEIPDAIAGQLHLGAKADLRTLLQALVEQHVAEGGLTVVSVGEALKLGGPITEKPSSTHEASERAESKAVARPQRDVLGRLRGIYGDMPSTGENAVLVSRRMERY